MARPISRQMHGIIGDIPSILFVGASPYLFNFQNNQNAVTATWIVAGMTLLTTLFTRFELGLFRILPFKAHLMMDAVVSLFAIASPWLLGFSDQETPRNLMIGVGVFYLVVTMLSRPEEMPHHGHTHGASA